MSRSTAKSEYHHISVRLWFVFFGTVMVASIGMLTFLLSRENFSVSSWDQFKDSITAADPTIKLLVLGIYLAISSTFIPLNTSWIISASAMQATAVADGLWPTMLIVSLVGATASTMANLNDYHVFTLMMRSHHVAKVRNTKLYQLGSKWFNKSPFGLLLIFNILPIPIDFIRPLAASHKYPRGRFAFANFGGRFCRYMVIAGVTYMLGKQGWIAAVALLGFAIIVALPRLFMKKAPTVELEMDDE